MKEKTVLVKKKEMVCTLVMNRPRVKNAFSMETLNEFEVAFGNIAADQNIRVVVLEGAGGNFCAGADLAYFQDVKGAPAFHELMKRISNVVKALRGLPQPVICKIKGVAAGGGANLALAGDFVLSADNACFYEIFSKINIIPDMGAFYFLPRLVGLAKARELAFLGDMIDGKTAHAMGLIYKSVAEEKLDEAVARLAENLSQKSLAALSMIKTGFEKCFERSLDDVLEWESVHQAIITQTSEHKDAVERFLSKAKQ